MVLMQMVQQLAQNQRQQAADMAQMMKIMSAPKKLITDENGEPIGVEPVLDQKRAAIARAGQAFLLGRIDHKG